VDSKEYYAGNAASVSMVKPLVGLFHEAKYLLEVVVL
jgi:hypothetical protein